MLLDHETRVHPSGAQSMLLSIDCCQAARHAETLVPWRCEVHAPAHRLSRFHRAKGTNLVQQRQKFRMLQTRRQIHGLIAPFYRIAAIIVASGKSPASQMPLVLAPDCRAMAPYALTAWRMLT